MAKRRASGGAASARGDASIRRCIFTVLTAAFAAATINVTHGASNCNKSDGYLSEIGTDDESGVSFPDLATDSEDRRTRLDAQEFPVRLADLESLVNLSGPFTRDVPVLGLRVENDPGFRSEKCNRLFLELVRPRIERVTNVSWRASYDNKRFAISSADFGPRDSWMQDHDPEGKFFWIIPARLGFPALRDSYNARFLAEKSSKQRHVIATAYLNLAMRYARLLKLSQGFPYPPVPKRDELQKVIQRELQLNCGNTRLALPCLVSDVIEANEIGSPSSLYLAGAGFRASDSLYENSGISFGIRQMDAGQKDPQTEAVGVQLLPAIFKDKPLGQGLRKPIRLWDIDSLNQWYGHLGYEADVALSTSAAKELLLKAHADFVKQQSDLVKKQVDNRYPTWSETNRLLLTTISIDLQNNTGYVMRYPQNAKSVCAVLGDTTTVPTDKRTNRSIVTSQRSRSRVLTAYRIFAARFRSTTYDSTPCDLLAK